MTTMTKAAAYAKTVQEQTVETEHVMIQVRALTCTKNGSGTWDIELAARRPTGEELEMLHRLFPNTTEQAWKLLDKEVLLSAMVDRR